METLLTLLTRGDKGKGRDATRLSTTEVNSPRSRLEKLVPSEFSAIQSPTLHLESRRNPV